MQDSYDVTESLFSAKANEGMMAFNGFQMRAAAGVPVCQGVLKISAFTRPDGNGYLTLTFLVDLADGPGQRAALTERFRHADQNALAARLGPDFEMLLEMPLNAFTESERFYIEEFNLYFRRLAGRERLLLEGIVIPVLTTLLDVQFDPMDWLTDLARQASAPSSGPDDVGRVQAPGEADSSLIRLLKQRLGIE